MCEDWLWYTRNTITNLVLRVFNVYINDNCIPEKWKEVRMVFIPKAGKINHLKDKNYRSINISSCLLEVLERILYEHIRSLFTLDNISPSQHGYIKGMSTTIEKALYEVVRTTEFSIEHIQQNLAEFLDMTKRLV